MTFVGPNLWTQASEQRFWLSGEGGVGGALTVCFAAWLRQGPKHDLSR